LSFPCRSHQELLQLPLRGIAHHIFRKFHTVIVSSCMVSRPPCFCPGSVAAQRHTLLLGKTVKKKKPKQQPKTVGCPQSAQKSVLRPVPLNCTALYLRRWISLGLGDLANPTCRMGPWGASRERKEQRKGPRIGVDGFLSSFLSSVCPQAKGQPKPDVAAALPKPSRFPLLLLDGTIFTYPLGLEEITDSLRTKFKLQHSLVLQMYSRTDVASGSSHPLLCNHLWQLNWLQFISWAALIALVACCKPRAMVAAPISSKPTCDIFLCKGSRLGEQRCSHNPAVKL